MGVKSAYARPCKRIFRITVGLAAILLLAKMVCAQDERARYFPHARGYTGALPSRENVWIFILAGQSNMAGRGIVQPSDTLPDKRILTITAENKIIIAKEPLHFYEPARTGLDCGMSFAKQLLQGVDKGISVLLVPAAVGGSSSHQWLGDSVHRDVRLMTNFQQRVASVLKYGTIKGILWHQGESDTNDQSIPGYQERLEKIFRAFRQHCGNPILPIVIGKLGSYSENQARWNAINAAIENYALSDRHAFIIDTHDLKSKEDKIHFDSEGQRTMGKRMASKFLDAVNR